MRGPHFLLFSDATGDTSRANRWRFVLQSIGGQEYLAAEDIEPDTQSTRLELLAVVRGLEALDQPSRVTLVTRSRYVSRGMRRGLAQWRARRWRWEHFGELVPIRDYDLWQRVDHALKYHKVDCCPWPAERLEGAIDADDETSSSADFRIEQEAAILPVPELIASGNYSAPRMPEQLEPAACLDDTSTTEQLLVRAPSTGRSRCRIALRATWSLANVVTRLRQGLFVPLTYLWRPAFTRTA